MNAGVVLYAVSNLNCVQNRGRRTFFPFTLVLHYNEPLLFSSLVITHYEIITLMWLVRKRRLL